MANYPTSVFAPATRNTGDTIQAAHVNDLQGEVVAIENALLNGIPHSITFSTGITVGGFTSTQMSKGGIPTPSTLGGTVQVFPPTVTGGNALVYSPSGMQLSVAGTETSGLQEAINHASSYGYNLVVYGGNESSGASGSAIIYVIGSSATLEFPVMRGKTLKFDAVTLLAHGNSTRPAVRFDSLMMVDLDMPGSQIVASSRTGHVVVFNPRNQVPVDAVTAITDSRLHINSISGVESTSPTAGQALMYFQLDGGGIGHTDFKVQELLGHDLAIRVQTPSTGISMQGNRIQALHIHDQNGGSNPCVLVGDATSSNNPGITHNHWELHIAGSGSTAKRGFDTHESRGLGLISCRNVGGANIFFEAEAAQNNITLATEANTEMTICTDGSTTLTNRVSVQAPVPTYSTITPGVSPYVFPSSTDTGIMAREVLVSITGGTVSAIEVGRGSTWMTTGFTAGMVPRSPGQFVRVTYSGLPTMARTVI